MFRKRLLTPGEPLLSCGLTTSADYPARILVRRIKDPNDITTCLDESMECLNSANEFDVDHLSFAKPGEIYRVWLCLKFTGPAMGRD